jgi:predicted TIM-barrel fold metal-dependent hydrolase
MSERKLTAFVAAAAAFLLLGGQQSAADYGDVTIADAHIHLLDFLQNGDYLEDGKIVPKLPGAALPAGQRGKRIEAVLWAMDRANVSHALLTGMPLLKKWSEDESFRSTYYLDSSSRVVRARDTDYHLALAIEDFRRDGKEAAQQKLERLYPCVSGFDATDLGAVDMIAKRMKEFPGLFRCIGEAMSRHDDLTNLTTGERPRANHPSLLRVFDFAGRHGIPVTVHHNIAPVSPRGNPRAPDYLGELVTAFDEFPETTFIWCHAGISRRVRVPDLPGALDTVLAKHSSHVYIDLSWVVYPDYVLQDLDAWAALIRKYPRSFMIGSDAVGRFGDYTDLIRIYDPLFEALEDKGLVEAIANGNFARIMPSRGITLDRDFMYPEDRYTDRLAPRPQP